jgi:hypothetical protein
VQYSGGTCYWQPLCPEPITRQIGTDRLLNLDFAHICAARPGGPRYDVTMADEQRRHFSNIILLCRPHHTIVDKRRPADFPVELLRRWKAEREANYKEVLTGLGQVTEVSLQQIIAAAVKDHDEQLRQVLSRLEQNDAEAAQMLRSVLQQLADLRHNLELAEQLSEAAWRLSLVEDEGLGEQLSVAGAQLYEVLNEGLADQLAQVADKLNRAADKFSEYY